VNAGKKVLYVVTTPVTPALFTLPVTETDKFNRQTVLDALADPAAGVSIVRDNSGSPSTVTFDPWNGQTKYILTQADAPVGGIFDLDTVIFESKNANGTVNNLCSTHREVRLYRTPFGPNGAAFAPPAAVLDLAFPGEP
jgi:hypothetical protein